MNAPARPSRAAGLLGGGRFFEKLYGVADGDDRLGLIVGNFDAEFLLERHHQLNRIERIGAEVVDEIGVLDNFVRFDAQVLDNDLFYALCDIAHFALSFMGRGHGPATN
jgi:hypothetical protein